MEEPIEVRYTFVMLLAIADPSGHVIGTDVAIARRLNMPTADFARCLAVLMEPDPDSNSPELDGRRVVESEGERGYRIVNYLTYRNIRSEEERREYMANYMKTYRARKQSVNSVNSVNSGKLLLAKAEAEEEAEAKGEAKKDILPLVLENEAEEGKYHKDSRTVLHLLNEAAGRHYRETDANLKFISARLSEPGVDLDGMRQMIARQCKKWNGTNMADYLRPETLFNKTKFDGYYAARQQPITDDAKPKPYQGAGTGGKSW